MDQDILTSFVATAVLLGVVYGTTVSTAGLPPQPKRGTRGGRKQRFHVSTQQTFTGDGCNMAANGKSGRAGHVWLAWVGIANPLTDAGNVRGVQGHMVPVLGGLDQQPGRFGFNTPGTPAWMKTNAAFKADHAADRHDISPALAW